MNESSMASLLLVPSSLLGPCSHERNPPPSSIQASNPCGIVSWPGSKQHNAGVSWKLSFARDCKFISSGASASSLRQVSLITAQQKNPLNAMISGGPASGKGTQCELIKAKFGLVHISAGDLLRAEVAAETDYGKKAKGYMDQGKLVPDDIVVTMVKERLGLPDAKEAGWLLDGYPRSLSQAKALEALNIRPKLFILLEVPEEILIERVAGRRLDPLTGKIYHLKHSPPETSEVSARLIQRSDDTEEKARLRLKTYNENLESVLSVYQNIIRRIDGNRPKNEVFAEIMSLLHLHGNENEVAIESPKSRAYVKKDSWRGVPTKLNSIPHSREIREYFYNEVCEATKNAVDDGLHKLKVEITIPELNPEMDVYRAGTLLELMRELAFTFANDGKRVKVCVQGAMGEGIFSGIPLQLSGARRMLEVMDWGDYGAKGTFVNIGTLGPNEVAETDDMFILMAPQNSVGSCIIQDLQAMVDAAGDRPVIIVNPKLEDVPGAGGVMQVIGRQERMKFADSFFVCYHFRLLYTAGTLYPIVGALRRKYPGPYEVYKRVDEESGKEKYVQIATFQDRPTRSELQLAFSGRANKEPPKGIWAFFSFLQD